MKSEHSLHVEICQLAMDSTTNLAPDLMLSSEMPSDCARRQSQLSKHQTEQLVMHEILLSHWISNPILCLPRHSSIFVA